MDKSYDCQNNRVIAKDPKDGPSIARTKNLAYVVVLGVISSKGDIMSPILTCPQGQQGAKKPQ